MLGSKAGTGWIYDRSDLTVPAQPDQYLATVGAQLRGVTRAKGRAPVAPAEDNELRNVEFYYKHRNEIQAKMNELYDLGAEIRAAGVPDPNAATDQASRLYQKKREEVLQLAKASMQVRDEYDAVMKEIHQQNGNFAYREEDIAATKQYFEDFTLAQHTSGETVRPMLRLQQPEFVMLQYDTNLANELTKGGKNEFSDQEIQQIAAETLRDSQVDRAVKTIFSDLTDEQNDALQQLAAQRGVTPATLLRYSQLRPLLKDPTREYDMREREQAFDPEVSASSREDGDRTTTWAGVPDSRIQATAELIADAEYVRAGVAQGAFGSADASLEENRKAAVAYNVRRLKAQKGVKSGVAYDEPSDAYGGLSEEEFVDSRNRWIDAMQSGNPVVVREAAGYMREGETARGLTADDVQVQTGGTSEFPDLINTVSVRVRGRRRVNDKLTGEVTWQPEEDILVPEAMTREELGALYDKNFFGQHRRTPFGQASNPSSTPSQAPVEFRGLGAPPSGRVTAIDMAGQQ